MTRHKLIVKEEINLAQQTFWSHLLLHTRLWAFRWVRNAVVFKEFTV